MRLNVLVLILVMAGTTYLIRMLPLTLFRKKIESPFAKSFFHYVPYTVLAAMTFPTIFFSVGNILSACVGFAVAVILALIKLPLPAVAAAAALACYIVSVLPV